MEWYLKPWKKYADFSGRARKLHDTNRSGWQNQFAGILSMKWLCQDSDIGENDFGQDPKAEED